MTYFVMDDSEFAYQVLTERGAKVLVHVERLVAASVAQVPDAERLVVGGAEQVLATSVEYKSSHPIVMACQGEQAQASRYVPHLKKKRTFHHFVHRQSFI